MKIANEIEGEFNEIIPNQPEIPSTKENAEKHRKQHGSWNNEVNKNRGKDFSKLPYWEKASMCTAL